MPGTTLVTIAPIWMPSKDPSSIAMARAVNRIFALPSKLGALGVLPISKGLGDFLNTVGIWAFFIVIGGFSVWVIGTFLKNIDKLKGEVHA